MVPGVDNGLHQRVLHRGAPRQDHPPRSSLGDDRRQLPAQAGPTPAPAPVRVEAALLPAWAHRPHPHTGRRQSRRGRVVNNPLVSASISVEAARQLTGGGRCWRLDHGKTCTHACCATKSTSVSSSSVRIERSRGLTRLAPRGPHRTVLEAQWSGQTTSRSMSAPRSGSFSPEPYRYHLVPPTKASFARARERTCSTSSSGVMIG